MEESTGRSLASWGSGCKPKGKPCLLGGKQARPAPSRQGWRVPRPRFAACGLERLLPPPQGRAIRARLIAKREPSMLEVNSFHAVRSLKVVVLPGAIDL